MLAPETQKVMPVARVRVSRTAETRSLFARIASGRAAAHARICVEVMFGTITYSALALTGAVPWSKASVTNGCVFGVVSLFPPSAAQVPVPDAREICTSVDVGNQ